MGKGAKAEAVRSTGVIETRILGLDTVGTAKEASALLSDLGNDVSVDVCTPVTAGWISFGRS